MMLVRMMLFQMLVLILIYICIGSPGRNHIPIVRLVVCRGNVYHGSWLLILRSSDWYSYMDIIEARASAAITGISHERKSLSVLISVIRRAEAILLSSESSSRCFAM